MRLIILPFDDELKLIESDVLEIESSNSLDIKNKLQYIMKGKLYQIEVYKNLQDSIFIQLEDIGANGSFNYEKIRHKIEFENSPYEKVIELIKNYIEDSGSEKLNTEFLAKEEERKKIEKEKYKNWKKDYDVKLKSEKKGNTKFLILFLLGLSFLFSLLYLWWIDELRFIGRTNIEKKGIITYTKFFPVGTGHKQKVTYKYTFNNKLYKNNFIADRFTGKKNEGDSIKIKFRESNPSIVKTIHK